jgi:hypothetical protein
MIVVAPADGGYQKIAVSVSGGACITHKRVIW